MTFGLVHATISDKNLETLCKILLSFISSLPFAMCCSHVTLQSHLNIAEGKENAWVFQGFLVCIVTATWVNSKL